MNSLLKRSLVAAVIGVPVLGVCLLPALAQPSGGDPAKAPASGHPPEKKGGDGERPGRGERGQRSQWAEQYRQELREHPRLARALVGLHEAKDYIEKAPTDFGGHKATSIKAIDDAIKELKETLKFDPKRIEPEGRGEGPGDGPGKGKGEKKDKKND